MNARLEAKLGMINTVIELNTSSAQWASAIAAKPTINDNRAELQTVVGTIMGIQGTTEGSTIPITTNKTALRRDMEYKAAGLASLVYPFAVDESLIELATALKPWRKKSAFVVLKDNETNAQAQIILEIVSALTAPQITDLETSYGLVATVVGPPAQPGTIDQLGNAITAYNLAVALPESAIEDRKAANIQLKAQFDLADEILDRMDSSVYDFQFGTLVNFYNDYFAARVIFDPVVTHTGFRGTVIHSETLLPIQGVKVRAIPTDVAPPGEEGITVETTTDENGYYTLATPQYKNNPYTLQFLKTGLQSITVTDQYVKRGVKNTVDKTMIPITP